MRSKIYRVIQYGAGNTGKFVLGSILTHPALELVGLGVHSEAKNGLDAGSLCRLPPTGVLATRDIDALLTMDADCVSFMPTDPHAGDTEEPRTHSARLFDLLCTVAGLHHQQAGFLASQPDQSVRQHRTC